MQKNCLDLTKSRHSSRTKIELEIIHFKEDWDFDVFAIQDISSSQASLFCSGEAKKIFEDSGIRCVKYIPLSDINASMLPHMNELYRPVGFYDPV